MGTKYIRNILSTKSANNAFNRGGLEEAKKRKYSQRTYMGGSNG